MAFMFIKENYDKEYLYNLRYYANRGNHMQYLKLAEIYEQLESSSKRLEKTDCITQLLKSAIEDGTNDEEFQELIFLLRGRLFPDWDERKLGVAARIAIKAISRSTGRREADIDDLWREKGDLGLVALELTSKKVQFTLTSVDLNIRKVFSNFRKLAGLTGAGTVDGKISLISELLTSAEPLEAKFIIRTVLEDLRVGIGEGTIRDAIAWTFLTEHKLTETEEGKLEYKKAIGAVQHAYDILNEFSEVAIIAKNGGMQALKEVKLEPGRPIKVMLAQKSTGLDDAFARVGKPAAVEYKYDGFRMQIHKNGDKVRIFTRRLEEVSKQFPEVIEYFSKLDSKSFILDGEAVGYNPSDGKYLPFQHISQRIRRKYGVEEMAKKLPVEINLFDLVYLNGQNLIKSPFSDRRKALEGLITPHKGKVVLAVQIITADEQMAQEFYEESLAKGNEGVMFKTLDNEYKPGLRVGFMVKLKPTMESLDLVITGAEWGEGKRAHWLTSFTLSCLEDGQFKEIGKVGTGIKELESEGLSFGQLTELLRPHIIAEKGRAVSIKPVVVVEIKYEEIQSSPTYSSGYALRFPRVVKLRDDLNPDEASSLDQVHDFYDGQ